MAVRVGKPRLIDNFLYENGQWLTGEVAQLLASFNRMRDRRPQ